MSVRCEICYPGLAKPAVVQVVLSWFDRTAGQQTTVHQNLCKDCAENKRREFTEVRGPLTPVRGRYHVVRNYHR